MKNLKYYYIPSCLILYFYFNITILGLVDSSSIPLNGSKSIDASKSSKHGTHEETNEAKSKGQTQLPNSEGELQALESTKLTGAGSKKRNIDKRKTASHKSVTRSQKIDSRKPSKVPKGKKSKSSTTAGDWHSEEADWNSLEMQDDNDIWQKANEHTTLVADDYDWGSEEDWDTLVAKGLNGTYKLNIDSAQDYAYADNSGSVEPNRKQDKRKLTSSVTHKKTASKKEVKKTTSVNSKSSTKAQQRSRTTNKADANALVKIARSTPEPNLRGFEESGSAITAEVVPSSEYEVEDYNILSSNDSDDLEYSKDSDSDYLEDTDEDYSEDTDEDYLEDTDEDYSEDTDEDYLDDTENSDDFSKSTTSKKPQKTKNKKNTKQVKRKKSLKKQRNWIKGQKRERKAQKLKRRKQSLDGMRMTRGRQRTSRKRGGPGERDLSRRTRLGLRRRLSGRHYGRNVGKRVYWKNNKRTYIGPRRRFALRGKAKDNARVNKAPRG